MFKMSSYSLMSVTSLSPWELRDLNRLTYTSLADDTICDILE